MTTKGHNTKSEQEEREDQRFMRGFADLKELKSELAGTKGDMNAIYTQLKEAGWSKQDIAFAETLQNKDVRQVVSDFEHKIRIAKLFGHSLGRQVEMFETDRAPQDERAYDEGYASGMLREVNTNPYQTGSREANKWQEGFNNGTAQVNKDLAVAIDYPFPPIQ